MQYTSDKFQLHYLSSYSLLIKTSDVQDMLLVLNQQNEIIKVMVYEIDQPLADATKLLSLPFSNVYVSLPHESLTLIPSDMYIEEDKVNYSKYLQRYQEIETYTTQFNELGVTAIFQYDVLQINKWKAIYPNAKFVPEFAVLLEQAQPNIPTQGKVIGLHFNAKRMDVFLFINGDFILYNNFEVINQHDVIFYLLQIFKNFDLNIQVDKMLCSGIPSNHEYLTALQPYADSIEFLRHCNPITTADKAVDEKLFSYNILLDTPICEL